jgi:predicted amidohydrolase YtcJ
MKLLPCLSVLILTLNASAQKNEADLVLYHATIYTVDAKFSIAEAIAIKEGKILATGTSKDILAQYSAKEVTDAKGKFIYPGFIDAHAHFFEYGLSLQTANLEGTLSWEEVLQRLTVFAHTHPDGWLRGIGWDQNDWNDKSFPEKEKLDSLFPGRPVYLTRVDGHAAIANQKAFDLAGVTGIERVSGGELLLKNGKPAGVLIDNAMELVTKAMPSPSLPEVTAALIQAQKNCFAAGLTTIDDCGLDHEAITLTEQLQKNNTLKMRMYMMLSDAKKNYDFLFARGEIKTERLHVNAFKVYADGALGSRGACLLQPYSDAPDHSGFLIRNISHYDSVAKIIYAHGFQMCTHAIGDSGNRMILHTYVKYLQGKNDRRWRIEHAQVINKEDFALFGKYSIIPSVQPTHATSDMYWAGDRLGPERVKGAYAFKQLMDENHWIPLGTDFPVEDIDPRKTFYAAVFRKDAKGWPEAGYQMNNALTRREALQGMTIWAAKSNFEEKEKGSLERGKFADLVILDEDIMKAGEKNMLNIQVLQTYVGGELVYSKEK